MAKVFSTLDQEETEMLDMLCLAYGANRADIVRKGVRALHKSLNVRTVDTVRTGDLEPDRMYLLRQTEQEGKPHWELMQIFIDGATGRY